MPVYSDAQNSTTNGSGIHNSRLSFPSRAEPPGSPTVGDAYFHTGDQKLKVYDGSAWVEFPGS